MPPSVGVLWTPGYWGWGEGVYVFHAGYWGPHVGFYGGGNYGFGYGGGGFCGGEWRGGRFFFNTPANNRNTPGIPNTYVYHTVSVNKNTRVTRISYTGGPQGIPEGPTPAKWAGSRESHFRPTTAQVSHQSSARGDKSNFASVNHGKPATPTMSKVNAREANQQARIGNAVKPGQLTPHETKNLEKREGRINQEVQNDRMAK